MNLELVRTQYGLCPIDDESIEAIKKVKMGDAIIVEWKPRRNIGHHRKLFSMLRAVLPHQDFFKSEDHILDGVKLRAGYFETGLMLGGGEYLKPKSIAFHKLDQAEFERFYNEAHKVCCELVTEDALDEILRYI